MRDGPTLIYDKSVIQGLNPLEAKWLHHHFHIVMTQTIFMEIMADLKKPPRSGKTEEEEVAAIARKIPHYEITPNIYYRELILGDLAYEQIEMGRRPYLGGGKRIKDPRGGYGVFFDESTEEKAMRLWAEGNFFAAEQTLAEEWRSALERIDLAKLNVSQEWTRKRLYKLKTPEEVAAFIRNALQSEPFRFIQMAIQYFKIDTKHTPRILMRWQSLGKRPIAHHAPYTAHCIMVDMLFMFMLAKGQIAETRPTNWIDFSYLYYLPFTKIFTSNDHLHKKFAPLLMGEDQLFIPFDELKKGLAELARYYEALPEKIKETGTINYARFPPYKEDFIVCKIYDRLYPDWRERASIPPEPRNAENDAKLMEKLRPMLEAIKEAEGK